MVTTCDDKRQPGEYRAIYLWKVGRQSFAKLSDGRGRGTILAEIGPNVWGLIINVF